MPIAHASATAAVRHGRRLELRRPDPLSGDVQRVVGAAVEIPAAVLVDRRPVAVRPHVRPSRPVRVEVALRVAPHAAGHRRPGLAADELAHLTGRQVLAVRPRDVDGHPERRPAERARLERHDRHRREEAGADLGSAREVDDRRAALADDVVQPQVGVGVPRLAGRREDADRRAVVLADVVVAVRAKRADQRGRDAEHRDPVPLDELPQPARAGIVGRALRHARASRRRRPAPMTTHGPMIQPMSVTHITRSSAWTSAWKAASSAIFTRSPPCTWTAPFGRPVVPDV